MSDASCMKLWNAGINFISRCFSVACSSVSVKLTVRMDREAVRDTGYCSLEKYFKSREIVEIASTAVYVSSYVFPFILENRNNLKSKVHKLFKFRSSYIHMRI